MLIYRNCELTFETGFVKKEEMIYPSFLLRHRTSLVFNAYVDGVTRRLKSVVC